MGAITGFNHNNFISADIIYSQVRRFLSSFSSTNSIDEGEFPVWTAEVLSRLGISAMREEATVLYVGNDFRAKLPDNFTQLYAAYKCKDDQQADRVDVQQNITLWNDVTIELLRTNQCQIDCNFTNAQILEKITIKQLLGTKDLLLHHPVLLRLSPNVHPDKCTSDCLNVMASASDEISLNDGFMFTNFKNSPVFMQYYGMPLDSDGMPMVPNIPEVRKAIQWYIIYRIALSWWWNNEVPDIQAKYQTAELEYNKWLAESRYILKLPAFSTLVNSIRNKRGINKVSFFSTQDRKRF